MPPRRLVMLALAGISAVLAAPAAAPAKELSSVAVCGAAGCNTLKPGDKDAPRHLEILAEGGAETAPPKPASGFYTVRMTSHAERERHSWSFAWVPKAAVIRVRDEMREGGYVWLTLPKDAQAALERASSRLQPIAASKLRGLDIKPPTVTVHKVVEPPADALAAPGSDSDGAPWGWIAALVGAALAATVAVLLGLRRRRRGRAPLAAPAQ